ncbi:MAG TPA: helix-turn-helix domain-containing protein [Aggregatilineales bacterium]|nr:helix-turn-helix domain-containing protein [Aggregatilineales bacterium]
MDLIECLVAVGFTEYEAKIYLQLLRDSPTTGYQLAKNAGIPRSMVYEALGRLRNRGAVLETLEERATLYRPLPPDVLLDNHAQEQQQLLESLRAGLRPLYEAPEEEHLWTLTGQQAIYAYAVQMIGEAKESLMFVLPDPGLDRLRASIAQAQARGVLVSALLTGTGNLDSGQVARHPPLESEIQHLTGMLVILADDHEVLIAGKVQDVTGTITRNRHLVAITRQFIWMELFTQRIYARLGPELLAHLEGDDRRIFESLRDDKET